MAFCAALITLCTDFLSTVEPACHRQTGCQCARHKGVTEGQQQLLVQIGFPEDLQGM